MKRVPEPVVHYDDTRRFNLAWRLARRRARQRRGGNRDTDPSTLAYFLAEWHRRVVNDPEMP